MTSRKREGEHRVKSNLCIGRVLSLCGSAVVGKNEKEREYEEQVLIVEVKCTKFQYRSTTSSIMLSTLSNKSVCL